MSPYPKKFVSETVFCSFFVLMESIDNPIADP